MLNFDAGYKQRMEKGYFFQSFRPMSLKVVTAKFDMSDDLVRSIFKAKLYKFIS